MFGALILAVGHSDVHESASESKTPADSTNPVAEEGDATQADAKPEGKLKVSKAWPRHRKCRLRMSQLR
jgi:hypothetical protein